MKRINYPNFVILFLIAVLIFCCIIRKDISTYETRIQVLEDKIDKVEISELQQILDNQKGLIYNIETNRDYIYSCVDDINENTKTIETQLSITESLMEISKIK